MGLTIHFDLGLPAAVSRAEAVERLRTLQAGAMSRQCDFVGPIFETHAGESLGDWPGDRREIEQCFRTWAWLQLDGAQPADSGEGELLPDAVGFVVVTGKNCEPAMFGLAWVPPRDAEFNLLANEPPAWRWHYACKTQYASISGDDHFVKCHTTLIALLDEAARLGFEVAVEDEGGFWETRDVDRLLASVQEMNRIVARFGGALHDAIGSRHSVEGAIFGHPDFERLEME